MTAHPAAAPHRPRAPPADHREAQSQGLRTTTRGFYPTSLCPTSPVLESTHADSPNFRSVHRLKVTFHLPPPERLLRTIWTPALTPAPTQKVWRRGRVGRDVRPPGRWSCSPNRDSRGSTQHCSTLRNKLSAAPGLFVTKWHMSVISLSLLSWKPWASSGWFSNNKHLLLRGLF